MFCFDSKENPIKDPIYWIEYNSREEGIRYILEAAVGEYDADIQRSEQIAQPRSRPPARGFTPLKSFS